MGGWWGEGGRARPRPLPNTLNEKKKEKKKGAGRNQRRRSRESRGVIFRRHRFVGPCPAARGQKAVAGGYLATAGKVAVSSKSQRKIKKKRTQVRRRQSAWRQQRRTSRGLGDRLKGEAGHNKERKNLGATRRSHGCDFGCCVTLSHTHTGREKDRSVMTWIVTARSARF